uniref:Endosomal transmembrane epsin interactor 1 n=1 Tax=Aotus nancymaae TaxID=37293 RepID=A0A2K5CB59_AOTNA
ITCFGPSPIGTGLQGITSYHSCFPPFCKMKSRVCMTISICQMSMLSFVVCAFRYRHVFKRGWPMGTCCLFLPTAAPVLSCEAATQTERRLDLAAVTLRRGLRSRASRCRPRSLIDYKSYMDTKLLVARFLEQSSCSMTPDIHELVENIKSVLKSDEEHMEEAITSASFLEQIMAPSQPSTSRAHTLPSRRQPGLLHLQSCGDLSTFTPAGRPHAERRPRRVEAERPHSLIGVIRETVL